ncbi:glutathione S-transferase family protein [Ruegeria sp. Ofav3-42]|uniref:glutathione S-transferase family protein n=1 Tax=Ruegeria sp. Ofav3-42 TaxID=2917759 RepID=UPI001EF58866|nr:glutathione S-transferase family protein [Ruegeria sp. Ofav3-42]MCG7522551.1 glutathione S-transferase family protein [Ruegeria sp. Ofav3-42]
MIKLYDYELSGNCYKLRLLMSFLGLEHEAEPIDFYPGNQHKSPEFRQINPLGQLPVIDDEGLVLRDAQAILVYLASKYDTSENWYPSSDPAILGQVSQWLAFADGITTTASAARLHDAMFYTQIDVDVARAGANKLFRILDEHLYFAELDGQDWICPGDHPTIADIACFPYIMLSEEGGVSRMDYPAIRRWTDRFKRIPGFVVMSGVFPAGPAVEKEAERAA